MAETSQPQPQPQPQAHDESDRGTKRVNGGSTSYSSYSSKSSSFHEFIGEATFIDGANESRSLDDKIKKALDCPCVAGIRNGPCGAAFSDSFVCFMKSTADEKGSDCIIPFLALKRCIEENPDSIAKESY